MILPKFTARLTIFAIVVASLSGCDPVRTTRQNVNLAVVDSQGAPAADVKVSIKESWESWQTWGGGTPESEKPYFQHRWAHEIPWLRSATNAEGKAVIVVEETALDWTKGSEPPASRDIVSNREYMVRLDGKLAREEFRLPMNAGASQHGTAYSVTVDAIDKPRYVPTPEGG